MNHWKLDKNKSRFCVQVLAWTNRHSRITKSTSTRLNGIGRRPICGTGQLKRDGTRAETRFRLSVKRTSPFKSAGGVSSVDYWQPEVCPSAVVMLDTPCSEVVWRVLATHSIRQFFLSLPLPYVTVCHHISTGLSYVEWVAAKLSMEAKLQLNFIHKNCNLLRFYETENVSFLPTFRDNHSVLFSGAQHSN